MKYAINIDHIRFWREHQCLILQDLFSPAQVEQLLDGINAVFTRRLGVLWRHEAPDQLFVEGRDLHCDNETIMRIICQKKIVTILSEVFDCKPLRLGFDQYLPANIKDPTQVEDPYGEFLRQGGSLDQISCLKGIAGALLICLQEPDKQDPTQFFPSVPGEATILHPSKLLPLYFLDEIKRGSYLLITYTDQIALYVHNERDPHVHTFKRWGYVFGDKLREPYHPIILR